MTYLVNPFTAKFDAVRGQGSLMWGSFYDTTTQTAAVINTAYPISINSTDPASNGVSIASGSRITFARGGIYSVTYSVQLTNSSAQMHDVNIWLRKNDSGSTGDIVATDSKFTVNEKHGAVNGAVIGCVNYVLKLIAADYLELIWSTDDLSCVIQSFPASTSGPAHPSVPGIIVTAFQIA
jgi:hypothetical protein